MPVEKLKKFLDDNHVEYVCISHSKAFTAQKIASAAHIKGEDIAKTVMVRIEGRMAMVVLPASKRIDFEHLREVIGNNNIRIATEEEFKDLFPACETGAMPPFGNLYEMDVYVDRTLKGDHEIAFNAGTHIELIQMKYEDFERLVNPTIIDFSVQMVG